MTDSDEETEAYMGYLYLTVAIIAEVIATNALKASDEFTNGVAPIKPDTV